MVCEHLRQLEDELIAAGVREKFRGRAWSRNCREWVYFDCYLDRDSIRQRPFERVTPAPVVKREFAGWLGGERVDLRASLTGIDAAPADGHEDAEEE